MVRAASEGRSRKAAVRIEKRQVTVNPDFAFHRYLWIFYEQNRGRIRQHYRELSKKFLAFNDPAKALTYLREPQFQALEVYVFLKEFLDNKPIHQLFQDWYQRTSQFEQRQEVGRIQGQQAGLFGGLDEAAFEVVFKRMRDNVRRYPNYIFALTMGTGKTILMATCIFYEFILANKFPADPNYCHNALVFAPDKTVLQSLKEIQDFDLHKVVPPEYANFLTSNLNFHFLEEAGTTLNLQDKSRFNIIISNTQKIILKKQHAEKSEVDLFFGSGKPKFTEGSVYDQYNDLYDEPEDEGQLQSNQRFEKLKRLEQLGIYVDEAHHAFGKPLARDMGLEASDTSLRATIDILAARLEQSGTRVVACFNYTGTPYVGREVLPEVVYAYGLQEAISKGFLKKVKLHGYTNTRSGEFIRAAVDDFISNFGNQRAEGMLPKIAFFAATIEEMEKELRPAVEKAIAKHGISSNRILVNVGDPKLTSNDDIREFNRLDTPESEKQFILLVNKGKEGWNCRSLFGVGMFRQPKSKVFVLQATMRCLRQIGDGQPTAQVYLSEANKLILNEELEQNFRITAEDLENAGKEKITIQLRTIPPPVKIKLKRIQRMYQMSEKQIQPGLSLELDQANTERYRITHTVQEGLPSVDTAFRQVLAEDLTALKEKRPFSRLTLVAEIARYLNLPPLRIEDLLQGTAEGTEKILADVNEFNELLYDHVIPRLFAALYDLKEFRHDEENEVELIKQPPPERPYYEVRAEEANIVRHDHPMVGSKAGKSFHLDAYCFDSGPEQRLFWDLLNERKVGKVYFTGMLTHGQSDFYIQYIDPESHTLRRYYPDFIFQKADNSWVIVEVKGDNLIDDPIVQAKAESTRQIANASKMIYQIIAGSEANAGRYRYLLD